MLREKIAKRLSSLKKSGLEFPIIDEVALPADVITEEGFFQTGLSDYSPQGILDLIQNFPVIMYGHASGPVAGIWYKVSYPQSALNTTPVAIGKARSGSISSRPITQLANMALQEITRVNRDDFNSGYYCDIVAKGARDRAKTLVPLWPLDAIWGWMCDTFVYGIFYAGWYMSGWVLNVLWDSFIQVQIDRVRDSINSAISNTNTKFTEYLTRYREAINLRLNDLYTMWGVPTNTSLTPLHIRNATSTGFEFQSYGSTDCYWIAIGKKPSVIS